MIIDHKVHMTDFRFRIQSEDGSVVLTEEELGQFARFYGLDAAAPGRFSWLFVLQTMVFAQRYGIDPFHVVDEIKALEGGPTRIRTKPASEFQHPPLRGLWHKHFFSARFIARNMFEQLKGRRLLALAEEVFDPAKSPVVTDEMINELSHRATIDAFEERDALHRLTGEWIVFAKRSGANYYLALTTHQTGDDRIFEQIRVACFPQFPFLEKNKGSV
jgi:hypothetical protein